LRQSSKQETSIQNEPSASPNLGQIVQTIHDFSVNKMDVDGGWWITNESNSIIKVMNIEQRIKYGIAKDY